MVRRIVRRWAWCAACVLAVTPGAFAQGGAGAPARYPDFRQVVQDAKQKVFPAVVYIKCIRESTEGGKKESQEVSGSGVIISPGGEVLTNWHVVDKATSVRCLLSDGRRANAKVLGTDKDTDLGLLQLAFDETPGALPHAVIGDSTVLREGDFVMAMGAPWGLNRSVSIGIVSCTTRFLDQISEYSLWIQTDAAINPGNSGGPLINTDGQIVGINARGMSGAADGMAFAIPSDTVNVLVPQLRAYGRVNWSWFGLQLQPLKDFNRDMYFEGDSGVIVAETDPDSPARRAGIQAKDRIVRVDGQAITASTAEDLPAVRRRLGLLPQDRESAFEIIRGDQTMTFSIAPREKGKVEGDERALERFDFTVKTINQFDNPDLFFHRQSGVFVYGVKYPGNAANAGLGRNDIILKIDGRDVKTLDDVQTLHTALVEKVAVKSRVVIMVLRGGLMRQIVLDFARDYSRE
ncbi:MAG: trypsin-like peptidase domain-containing protein [Phycisphaerales bacterium]